MDQAIIKGMLLGLTLAILIGPVFFALLHTSMHKGFVAGLLLAVGISISDSIYIFITNFFVTTFSNLSRLEEVIGILGGIILVAIGVRTFLKKPRHEEDDSPNGKWHHAGLIIKGMLLNFAHPGVLIFWLGVVSLISTTWDYSLNEKITLYSTTVATVFATDMLKAFLANKISRFLTDNIMLWMNRVMGIILIAFGCHLFISTVW